MKRASRRLGTLLIAAGAILIAYAAVTLVWRDPVTDLYTRWRQDQLSSQLERTFDAYRAQNPPAVRGDLGIAAKQRLVGTSAKRFRRRLHLGDPLGRIVIPKLHLDPVFVHGTRWGADLSRGPGHYERTSLPGLGRTTAIAGHRTTFGAPFRHIDDLRRGDEIVLELPYGTFHYRVFRHEIVRNDDWSIVRERGFDALVLSACHPLYSASHRWIVYGRLVEVKPTRGPAYQLPGGRRLIAAAA